MAQEISYSQFLLASDPAFVGRIGAILKDEGYVLAGEDASPVAWRYVQDVASQPGIADAYHAALIADPPVEMPGAADQVIPDPMLLAAVSAVMDGVSTPPAS